MKLKIEDIAKVCHEANKALCESLNDFSQPPWRLAEPWQKISAIEGIKYKIDNPEATPENMHESWLALKEKEGWKWGEIKNPKTLRHPCMVPYKDLPSEQRIKDYLFSSVCTSLIPLLGLKSKDINLEKSKEVHPDDEALAMDKDSKPGKIEKRAVKTLPSGKAMPVLDKSKTEVKDVK